MNSLIFRLLEVKVVAKSMIATLIDSMQDDLEVELTPTLLLEHKRLLLDDAGGVRKSWVKLEGHFIEDVGRDLVTLIVEEDETDGPFAHGETFRRGLDIGPGGGGEVLAVD